MFSGVHPKGLCYQRTPGGEATVEKQKTFFFIPGCALVGRGVWGGAV